MVTYILNLRQIDQYNVVVILYIDKNFIQGGY